MKDYMIMDTHHCIVVHAKNAKRIFLNRGPNLFGIPSGIFDHILGLGRVKFLLGHLARKNLTRNRRNVYGVVFVAHIDDRVSLVSR